MTIWISSSPDRLQVISSTQLVRTRFVYTTEQRSVFNLLRARRSWGRDLVCCRALPCLRGFSSSNNLKTSDKEFSVNEMYLLPSWRLYRQRKAARGCFCFILMCRPELISRQFQWNILLLVANTTNCRGSRAARSQTVTWRFVADLRLSRYPRGSFIFPPAAVRGRLSERTVHDCWVVNLWSYDC